VSAAGRPGGGAQFAQPGPYGVEASSFALRSPDAAAPHAVEAWLPRAPALRGLVLFSHGFGGHRRQSTFVLAHLASHGYGVLALDHHGPQLPGIMAQAMAHKARGVSVGPRELFGELPVTRPRELLALLPLLRAELAARAGASVAALPWAIIGHSFGAYTGLVAAARTEDIAAVVALAPAGGPGPVFVPAFAEELALDRLGHVHTLYLAAEHDTLVPLSSVEALCSASAGPTRMLVLGASDHVHFCDHVAQSHGFMEAMTAMPELRGHLPAAQPYAELCEEATAHAGIRAAVTAHLEHALHGAPAAQAFLQAPEPPIRLHSPQRRGSSPTP
jgi:dienelactone hydrolase